MVKPVRLDIRSGQTDASLEIKQLLHQTPMLTPS
jgi:hypothetical protein